MRSAAYLFRFNQRVPYKLSLSAVQTQRNSLNPLSGASRVWLGTYFNHCSQHRLYLKKTNRNVVRDRNFVGALLATGDRVVATTRKASSLASLAAAHSLEKLLVLELDLLSNDQIIAAFQKVKTHFGRCGGVVVVM
jgi:hypothetical protein